MSKTLSDKVYGQILCSKIFGLTEKCYEGRLVGIFLLIHTAHNHIVR